MGNIFNIDNKFFTFMGKVADVIILNLLFIVTCIPIVTIGTSVTALYSVSLKLVDDNAPYIAKEYFHAWKENFRQSMIFWVISMVVGALLGVSLLVRTTGTMDTILHFCVILGCIIYIMIQQYLFPLLAKFENTILQTIVNAFIMSMRHIVITAVLIAAWMIIVIPMLLNQSMLAQFTMFWMLFGFALVARVQAMVLSRLFDSYIPKTQVENEIGQ